MLDWKGGKAIYPEACLQNVAYRHAAAGATLSSVQGLIVQLPNTSMTPHGVPTILTLEDVLAALRLWRWQRTVTAQPEEPVRGQLRTAIGAVGLTKATIVVPAIERLREWKPWLEWAGQLPTVVLQVNHPVAGGPLLDDRPMALEEKVHGLRLHVIRRAATLGNVSQACR